MKVKPNLSTAKLWNISFGFFGVQIAYALQTANISRIFQTMGADPKSLSFFWVLPPLMGLIVQPFVGKWSDNTWTKWGRRVPYLIVGAAISVLVMCLLPNISGMTSVFWVSMLLGAIILMLLDTSLNMAMQPFKMMVGDMVNEEQKTKAYSIQSLLVNAGQVVGSILPFVLAYMISDPSFSNAKTAAIPALGKMSEFANGAVFSGIPANLTWSFYIGAFILLLCVVYTCINVKEMPPEEFALYQEPKPEGEKSEGMLTLLKKAPKTFWQVGLVQFFCWAAFLFMWSYTTGAIADTVWNNFDSNSKEFQAAGDWTGVIFGVQSLAAVAWAAVIPMFRDKKHVYAISLALGAAGFFIIPFTFNQWLLIVPFIMIGCTWAAMLALPFTMVTNALEGNPHMGTYLGLFNGTICLPQIVAALAGFGLMHLIQSIIGNPSGGHKYMLMISAVLLVIGVFCVYMIKETSGRKEPQPAKAEK